MKKKYMKPSIYIENFSLCQTIAAGCDADAFLAYGTVNSTEIESCGLTTAFGGIILVGWDGGICNIPLDTFEGLCYDNPNGGIVAFDS